MKIAEDSVINWLLSDPSLTIHSKLLWSDQNKLPKLTPILVSLYKHDDLIKLTESAELAQLSPELTREMF
ncbi:hypothetical protein PFISCL1PPCAC_11026, partial [Pristionchus fissidentatus]